MYNLITFDSRIKGLPPEKDFETASVFHFPIMDSSKFREWEVDEFCRLHLLDSSGEKIPDLLSEGLVIKDDNDRQFYCFFDSGVLIYISRIEYGIIFKNSEKKR
jgi:hypothetical protein